MCVCVSGVKIILAFGNYMNSSKRGAAYGFRLQGLGLVSQTTKKVFFPSSCRCFYDFAASCLQLLDTKSTDRKQTLLHYIVSIIQEKYPEVQNFYSELHFLDKAALGEHDYYTCALLFYFSTSPRLLLSLLLSVWTGTLEGLITFFKVQMTSTDQYNLYQDHFYICSVAGSEDTLATF